jgi:hypothetical protein
MVGESPHWVVVLDGYGQKEHGRVSYLHVRPFVIWAGGGSPPQTYATAFSVQGINCGSGTVSRPVEAPRDYPKAIVLGVCKLVFPGSPSLAGTSEKDFIETIKSHGDFTLEWNHQRETIRWRRTETN